MLSTTRSELVGCELKSSIEVIDLYILDQTEEVEVKEKGCVRIKKLYSQQTVAISSSQRVDMMFAPHNRSVDQLYQHGAGLTG
jgi:hypothetical protein